MAKKALGSAEGHAAARHCQSLDSWDTQRGEMSLPGGKGGCCVFWLYALWLPCEEGGGWCWCRPGMWKPFGAGGAWCIARDCASGVAFGGGCCMCGGGNWKDRP
jgi:hypothetical protein